MKKYGLVLLLCVQSVSGGDRTSCPWDDAPRSVFPSIVGRPRQSDVSPSHERAATHRSGTDSFTTREYSHGNSMHHFPPHPTSSLESYIHKRRTGTIYGIKQPPQSTQHDKSPLPFYVYTEKYEKELTNNDSLNIAGILLSPQLSDQPHLLNKKGPLFDEKDIVVTWHGDRQRGRDEKMDYLFKE